jgi:hypothetical protein
MAIDDEQEVDSDSDSNSSGQSCQNQAGTKQQISLIDQFGRMNILIQTLVNCIPG